MYLKNSTKSLELQRKLGEFMSENIYPNERRYYDELHSAVDRYAPLPLVDELKSRAKQAGLWNLFVPPEYGLYSPVDGLSNVEYQPLAEMMGRVIWSPEIFNCNAPDSGNIEVLMKYGSEKQKKQWLTPLLEGDIRSSYAMTEPDVGSSDATNIQTKITKKDDHWVVSGRKWFITGAMSERTRLFIVMGKSNPDNPDRYRQQTQVLVPRDTNGVNVVRPLTTLGYDDAPIGHAEVLFDNVKVPISNVLLGEGRGFEIAQGRLGPGRMHHCMRLVGAAQRAFELACRRASERSTFGKSIGKHQSVRESLSKCFSEIEMARLLVTKTASLMDANGVDSSKDMIAATKSTVPKLLQKCIDRCMQIHGAGGLSQDYPIAESYNYARWCRQADGPDEVHQMALGGMLIRRFGSEPRVR